MYSYVPLSPSACDFLGATFWTKWNAFGYSFSAWRLYLGIKRWFRASSTSKMLTKWLQPTRLETRTKESNMCASLRVEKPMGVMKVIGEILSH